MLLSHLLRCDRATTTAAGIGAAAGLAVSFVYAHRTLRNLRHRVAVEVSGPQEGFYAGPFGKLYYRASVGDSVYEVKPTSVRLPASGDYSSADVDYTFIEVPRARDESLVARSPIPRPALKLPHFACEIGIESADGVMTVLGIGFRAGAHLITARHVFDSPSKLGYRVTTALLRKGDVCVRFPITDANVTFPSDRLRSCTGHDCMAIEVANPIWAASTIRSLKPTDLSAAGEGTIEVFGRPGTTLMVSSGAIVRDDELEAGSGVVSHSANTTETYSGSPVVMTTGGIPKVVGMHISGGDGVNYAVSAAGLRKLLYKISFLQATKPGMTFNYLDQNESREGRRRQQDWDERSHLSDSGESEYDDEIRNRMWGGEERNYTTHVGRRASRRNRGLLMETRKVSPAQVADFLGWLKLASNSGPPVCCDGWVRRSCAIGAGFGRAATTACAETLACQGLIRVHTWHQELWYEVVVPEGDDVPIPSAPPLTSTCASTMAPDKDESRAAPVSSWGYDTFPFGEGTPKFWADTRDQVRPPLPATRLDVDAIENVRAWMGKGSWDALHELRGVGAASLLEHPALDEYKRYMDAGKPKFWPKKSDRASCSVNNLHGQEHALRVGTCERGFGKTSDLQEVSSDFGEALAGLTWKGDDLQKWVSGHVLPPSGPEAVKDSFVGQCARQRPGNWDRLREKPNFTSRCREFMGLYPPCPPPTARPFVELCDHFLDTMDGTKSAGWSARFLPGSKSAWLKERELLAYLASARLMLRVAEGPNIHYLSAESMVELGLMDPTEVFTKGEAHCSKKRAAKRWRLIWISSMLDSLCQSLLHVVQNKKDIRAYATGALRVQAVGLGHHDAGLQQIGEVFDHLARHGDDLQCSDASGWDLSVCRDAIYFDAERRISRFDTVCVVAKDLMYAEAACNSAHVPVIGTGLWTFHHFGVTASGIPSTSAQNSPIRAFTLEACGATSALAVGDDEVHIGDVDEDLLASTGCITKEGTQVRSPPTGPVEFTSHIFVKDGDRWTAQFDNLPKMLAHLDLRRVGNEPPRSDVIAGMRFALRHTPEADSIFVAVCDKMGWHVADPSEGAWEEL